MIESLSGKLGLARIPSGGWEDYRSSILRCKESEKRARMSEYYRLIPAQRHKPLVNLIDQPLFFAWDLFP
jgi:hypothetical protein